MEIKVSKEEFIELYKSMTVKQIAEKFNVKENQVIKIAKQLNISKPRGPKANKLILED